MLKTKKDKKEKIDISFTDKADDLIKEMNKEWKESSLKDRKDISRLMAKARFLSRDLGLSAFVKPDAVMMQELFAVSVFIVAVSSEFPERKRNMESVREFLTKDNRDIILKIELAETYIQAASEIILKACLNNQDIKKEQMYLALVLSERLDQDILERG